MPTSSGYRYVTIDGNEGVFLLRIAPDQHVAAYRPLPGRYTIPAVAMDHERSLRRREDAHPRPAAVLVRPPPHALPRHVVAWNARAFRGDSSRRLHVRRDGSGRVPPLLIHDELGGNNAIHLFRLRLEPGGDVAVALNGSAWLVVEHASFRVSSPEKQTSAKRKSFAWGPVGVGAAGVLALIAVSFVLVRRRRPATA